MNVLVFDPGGTTGWAFLSGGRIACGSFKLWEGVWGMLAFRTSIGRRLDAVVIEGFILRRGKALALSGSRLETIQVIGYIKAVCDFYNIPYVEQQPACKSIKIAKIEGANVHTMDAVKHGLYYMKKHGEARLYRRFLIR